MMTTATLTQANDVLRSAVKARLDATPADDPKMVGYSHLPAETAQPEPRKFYGSTGELQNVESDEPFIEHLLEQHRMRGDSLLRGDSLMRENAAPGSREWLDALDRLRALHHEKTAQYGGAEDAFENVTASAKCGVEPWRRALCDLSDCVVRMQKYAQGQPVDPTNALLDAANWALICLIKMEENANGNR
jgi:hypothetical protein